MKGIISICTVLIVMLLAFQNCQKINFSQDHSSETILDVICDPFDATSNDACPPGGGLIGNIYYRPANATWAVNSSQDLIQKGNLVHQIVQLSQFNIPERSFSAGFPIPGGGLVQNDLDQDLIEWFALDMAGYFRVTDPALFGSYQFGIASDDGVHLRIDNQDVVVNDTEHPTTWNCSSSPVDFLNDAPHDVTLQYFQGPRYHITLQVMLRPWSKRNLPCDASGEWTPVPASIIFHN